MNIEPVELVLRVALACEGAQEVGANRGPFVERCLKLTGNKPGDPWCAAAVSMIGYTALLGEWKLPKTAGCQVLADFAKKHDILRETGQRGDVFLIWHPELGRFAHTGFLLDPATTMTISGNTTVPGQTGNPREGWLMARKPWPFKPQDRFVRWSDL